MCQNILQFNKDKTETTEISAILKTSKKDRNLGVVVNSDLNFNSQIKYITKSRFPWSYCNPFTSAMPARWSPAGILTVISFTNVVMQLLCLHSYEGKLCVHSVMDPNLQCRTEQSKATSLMRLCSFISSK